MCSAAKESTCNAGEPSLIPETGRYPGEGIDYLFQYSCASLVAQTAKNLPAMWETWVRPLGWEDPLKEGMETHSSILAWEFHGQRSLMETVMGCKESDWATKHSTCLSSICNWKINNSNAFEYQINKLRYKMLILVKIWQFHSLLPLAREDNKYNSCKSKVLICFKSFDIVHIILHSNSSSGNL